MLVAKIKKILKNLGDDDLYKNWKIFEIVAARWLEKRLGEPVLLWNDVLPDDKEKLKLPIMDVGIDYISQNLLIAGQAKCYNKGYVPAEGINRTRLAALCGGFIKAVEYGTTDVKLANTRIKFNKITLDEFKNQMPEFLSYMHEKISLDTFNEIINEAKSTVIVEEPKTTIQELRPCQLNALAAIKPEGISRISMACGSGKSITTLEYIKRNQNETPKMYCVLVPTIILMHQWCANAVEYLPDALVIKVGTGARKFDMSKRPPNNTIIFVVVYNSFEYVKSLTFDKVFVDEAHHIDRAEYKLSGYLLDIKKSLNNTVLLSATFGHKEVDYSYTMRDAISDGILCDYDVHLLIAEGFSIDATIIKYLQDHLEFTNVLVYFNRIQEAVDFAKACCEHGIKAESISCDETPSQRRAILDRFRNNTIRLIASVNTLGEGIDMKNADCCCFARTLPNEVNTIQRIGRVLRTCDNKKMGHILIPIEIKQDDNLETMDIPALALLEKIAKYDYKIIETVKAGSYSRFDSVNPNCLELNDNQDYTLPEMVRTIVLDRMIGLEDGNWNYKCSVLKKYYEEFKKLPSIRTVYDNIKIGNWLSTQRASFKKNKLTLDQINALNSIDLGWNKTKDYTWFDYCGYLQDFYNKNARLPKKNEKDPIYPIHIGSWLNEQRMKFKKNKLDESQINALNAIDPDWNKTKDDAWHEYCGYLQDFYNKNNRLPKQSENDTSYPIGIGAWLFAQRQNFTKNNLDQYQIDALNSIDPDWNKTKDNIWYDCCGYLQDFYNKNNRLPKAGEKDPSYPINIGSWLTTQRTAFKNNKLYQSQIDALNAIDPDWNKTQDDVWLENCGYLQDFYIKNNRLPKQSENDTGYPIGIGAWLNTQRQNFKKNNLDESQINALNAIDSDWNKTKDDVWHDCCGYLQDFYSKNNRLPNDKEKDPSYPINIGSWLTTQREAFKKNKLDESQINALNAIDPDWNKTKDDVWYEYCGYLQNFYNTNTRLPKQSENDPSYPINIGSWLSNQREALKKNKLDESQINALNAIDPDWNKTKYDVWLDNCKYLQDFYYKNNRLPKAKETDPSYPINIGSWLSHQRQMFKKNKLDQSQIDALDLIDITWSW
jgi:superfamily II DNA or RNA helicase